MVPAGAMCATVRDFHGRCLAHLDDVQRVVERPASKRVVGVNIDIEASRLDDQRAANALISLHPYNDARHQRLLFRRQVQMLDWHADNGV